MMTCDRLEQKPGEMTRRWIVTGERCDRTVTEVTVEGLTTGCWVAMDAAGNRYHSSHPSRLYFSEADAELAADELNASEREAENRQARREATCSHDWVAVSHEEDRCSACGAYRFVADW